MITAKTFEELATEYGSWGYTLGGAGRSDVTVKPDGRWVATLSQLPQLSFFVRLAELANIPIDDIRVDTEDGGSGCDTCGYGAGTEYIVTFRPAPEIRLPSSAPEQ